jgi:hypothetical protein
VGDDLRMRRSGMQDRELYRQILGIEAPGLVERIERKLAGGRGTRISGTPIDGELAVSGMRSELPAV